MTNVYPFVDSIQLHVEGRISPEDARRQERTAREILSRLEQQPGIILADEVGMGKTFVALAVAVSVALKNRGKRPVVVMVPSSLKEKWPADFSVFRERCLPTKLASKLRSGSAESAVEFLKMLDDPPDRKRSIIFLTHGAMSRGLNDHWVMLAIICQALHRRRNTEPLKRALYRTLGDLLQMKWAENREPEIWQRLLAAHPSSWLSVAKRSGIQLDDDPVPKAILNVLTELDGNESSAVYDAIKDIPFRRSAKYSERITNARHLIKEEVRDLWTRCLQQASYRLPLLIMDEAHHLKNPDTRLASLFRSAEAQQDAEEFKPRGALGGVFERMLFLTATPFQLGHRELCSVLERFEAVHWGGAQTPECGRDGFAREQSQVRVALDAAQEAAVTLDHAWGMLKADDLIANGDCYSQVEGWWSIARNAEGTTSTASDMLACYKCAYERLKAAERQIRPWIIRHLKPRTLGAQFAHRPRRERLVGRSIQLDCSGDSHSGIPVSGNALLPFLLAARASSQRLRPGLCLPRGWRRATRHS